MISTKEAQDAIRALISPTGEETVPLTDAAGRVLAQPVVAKRTQPPFPASAMDGYALSGAAPGASFTVVGEAAAGARHDGDIGAGEAVRIFTGAPVPPGADRVIIQEDTTRTGDTITLNDTLDPNSYIRPAGTDFKAGDRIDAPRRLTAEDVALIAAMNSPEVVVRRRPVVALIPTGDELVAPGQTPGPDQIVSSNNYGLAAMLARIGAEPRLCAIARDDAASLNAALAEAAGADLIVTLGGASVGDHDLVRQVFTAAGMEMSFYKIAMRPGKPLMSGRLGDQTVIGLPGNPVSAMVCGRIFLAPAIERLLGLPGAAPARIRARLDQDMAANGPREHYMRTRLWWEDGTPVAAPARRQDSSLLSVLSEAGCLLVRAPHAPPAKAGESVEVIPLD